MSSITNSSYLNAIEELKVTFSGPTSKEEQELIRNLFIRSRDDVTTPYSEMIGIGERDESSLIRIAYLLAQQDGRKAAKSLSHFSIKDETVLVFLAKTCAQSSGAAAKYIGSLGITNEAVLNELAQECLLNMNLTLLKEDHKKITSALSCSFITERCRVSRFFVEDFFPSFLPGRKDFDRPLRSLVLFARDQFNPSLKMGELLEVKERMIHEHTNVNLSRKLTYWLGVAILMLQQCNDGTVAAFLDTNLLDAFLALRTPTLRVELTKQLSQFLSLPQEKIHSLTKVKATKPEQNHSIPLLIQMECLLLENIGIDSTLLKNFMNHIPNELKKDNRKLTALIELLKYILDSTDLTLETKEGIIKRFIPLKKADSKSEKNFIPHSTYSKRIANFLTIFLFQETGVLTPSHLDEEALINSLLLDKLKIPNDPYYIGKFYELLINHPRLKNKFVVYAGKMALQHEPQLFLEVLQFIDAVIHDRFQEERRQIEHNSHMLFIKKHYPDVFEKWMNLDQEVLFEADDDLTINFANTYLDFLCLGIDIMGSCLILDGNPERTRATMEGILNPKHQYPKIESKNGLIAGRVKLSLMISDIGLVCVIDDPYDNGNIKNSHELLGKAALMVKQKLGIPLVTRGGESYPWSKQERFHHPITSLPSEYSYEYVADIAERTVPFGQYTLENDLWIVGSSAR